MVLRTLWDQRPSMPPLFALGAATLVFVLAYLPNLRALMTVWNEDPNYNHGYLVIPIALFILWQQLSTPEPKNLPELFQHHGGAGFSWPWSWFCAPSCTSEAQSGWRIQPSFLPLLP